jgi:hypothetical protein
MRSPLDLHDAVQDLSEAISRRLILLDTDSRVIAYSIHETSQDRARLSHVLAHSDGWPAPHFTDDVCHTAIDELGSAVLLRLSDPRHVVGAILFFLESPEDAAPTAQLAVLRARAATLGPLVSLRSLYAGQDRHLTRQHLQNLVGTDPPRRRAAAEGLVGNGLIGVADRYCAVAVGTRQRDEEAGRRANWAAVEATLSFVSRSSTASVAGTMLDGGPGILVFPRPVVAERLTRILQRPDLCGSHAGIGPVVGSLDDIWTSFIKAQRALRVSLSNLNDDNPVVEWEGLGLDDLLVRLPLHQLQRSDLPAPLRLLLQARNADVLLGTLNAYLDAGGDAQATARTLVIHRSTLYYRLDRIRKLTGSDLSDGRTRRELHTGIRVAQLAGLWEF